MSSQIRAAVKIKMLMLLSLKIKFFHLFVSVCCIHFSNSYIKSNTCSLQEHLENTAEHN